MKRLQSSELPVFRNDLMNTHRHHPTKMNTRQPAEYKRRVHDTETDAQKFRDCPQFAWRMPGLWNVTWT